MLENVAEKNSSVASFQDRGRVFGAMTFEPMAKTPIAPIQQCAVLQLGKLPRHPNVFPPLGYMVVGKKCSQS